MLEKYLTLHLKKVKFKILQKNYGYQKNNSADLGEYIISLHPQQRIGEQWYRGTADAIYQNIYFLESENPNHLFILSGDHIYKMNYNKMLAAHIEKDADLTVATVP